MFVEILKDFLGQKPGARIDLSEVEAKALIGAGTAKALTEDPIAAAVQAQMAEAMGKITASLSGAIEGAVKQAGDAFSLSRKGQAARLFGDSRYPDGKPDPKKSFGYFLVSVRRGDRKALEGMGAEWSEWEDGVEKKAAMTGASGITGGFAVPVEHQDDISLRVHDISVVRKYCRVIPMGGKEVEIPTPNYTSTPAAGDTATLSAMVLRWAEEGGAVNASEPTLKQRNLRNWELSGYTRLSQTLLEDAPALETFIKDLFAEGVAWYEDHAFLRGDGVGKPLGMLTWVVNNSMTLSRSAASAVALADVAKMYARLLRGTTPDDKIFWVIQNTVIEKLLTMAGGDNVIFLGNDINGKPTWKILNHDVAVTEKLPGLNTAGDIILANGQHYLIGDRKRHEVAMSEHAAFTSNQTLFRVVSRVGGMPWLDNKVTLSDATTTLASFLALAAG